MDQTPLDVFGIKIITPGEAFIINTLLEATEKLSERQEPMAYNRVTINLELTIDAEDLQEFLSDDWESLKESITYYCSIESAAVTVPAGQAITINLDY